MKLTRIAALVGMMALAAPAAYAQGGGGQGGGRGMQRLMQGITLEGRKFRAKYVGTLPAVDGGSYGVVKDTDGQWKVDFTDTTATRVKLVGRLTGSPENQAQVLVAFIPANIQQIA